MYLLLDRWEVGSSLRCARLRAWAWSIAPAVPQLCWFPSLPIAFRCGSGGPGPPWEAPRVGKRLASQDLHPGSPNAWGMGGRGHHIVIPDISWGSTVC